MRDGHQALLNRPPSCVLTLDGGIPGTTEFSQLVIIERIVNDLQFRREDDEDLSDESEGDGETNRQLRPCDIFDYIAGSGTGGVFAILFEYFQFSVSEAKAFYYKLYNQVFAAPSWIHQDKENSRRTLEDSLKSLLPLDTLNKLLVTKGKPRQCRAFTCAANPTNNASPRLFRTYPSRQSTAPKCTVLDALVLSFADGHHLEPYPLGEPVELFSGSGHRFGNPTSRALQEIQAVEGHGRPLSCIVSIGVGIPGPLLEGDPRAILRDCEREAEELRSRCSGTETSSFG
ncbi:acyl transferase/acyl hydrolase/lysophospholipase [Flagelloscypha sp. PMI_526]|nr:acyl transferase/acyl hydrolase/lysophospholipase [Flagelloscypha sp. PMI_526]